MVRRLLILMATVCGLTGICGVVPTTQAQSRIYATQGFYNDTDTQFNIIEYGSGWNYDNSATYALAHNGDVHITSAPFTSVYFYFQGSVVTFWYTKAYNRGSFVAYIDTFHDGTWQYAGTYDAKSTSAGTNDVRRQVGVSWNVYSYVSVLRLDIYCDPGEYMDVDGFSVYPVPYSGLIDDSTSEIRFGGNWQRGNSVIGAYNQTITNTGIAKSYARITTNGSNLVYGFSRAPNRGLISITVDGTEMIPATNQYAPSIQRQVTQSINLPFVDYGGGVTRETHIVHWFVTGMKGTPSATDNIVDIDFVSIN